MEQQKNMKGEDHLKSNVSSNDKHVEDIISAVLAARFAEVQSFHLSEAACNIFIIDMFTPFLNSIWDIIDTNAVFCSHLFIILND